MAKLAHTRGLPWSPITISGDVDAWRTGATMRTPRRRTSLTAIFIVLALTATGVALAFWTSAANGSGSAATGTTQAVTLSPGTATAQLYPGGQAPVELSVTNPNPGSVRFGALSLDTSQGTNGFAVDGAHSTCSVASLTFTTQTNGGAGWTAGGAASLPITLADSLAMNTDAAQTCQGASFTVYLQTVP